MQLDSIDSINNRLIEIVQKVNNKLREYADKWEDIPLYRAAKYTLLSDGKRIRPLLSVASFEAVGGSGDKILSYACGLEMAHAASLIVDDLPCMDNDDLRRGLPTCHKVFGEATAFLGSQVLGSEAYNRLLDERCLREMIDTIRIMGIGQHNDDPEGKTGSLITLSVRIGGIVGGATEEQLKALTTYGKKIGYLFQVVDDIIDGDRTESDLSIDLSFLDEVGLKADLLKAIAKIIIERRI